MYMKSNDRLLLATAENDIVQYSRHAFAAMDGAKSVTT